MTHRPIARPLVLLTAALLLAGQGAALHHDHRSAADCPPGPCLEHAAGHDGPVATVSPDAACPFCEMLGHGRAAVPAPAPAALVAAGAATPALSPDARRHAAPALAAQHARAPPFPA